MSFKKPNILSASAAIAGAMFYVVPALAHHSFAPYDDKKLLTIVGTVKEVKFRNPHVSIIVAGTKDGKPATYDIRGRSPAEWRRDGWKPSDFRVGGQVNVLGYPRRDNPLELAIKTFTRVSDGKYFGAPPGKPAAANPLG
jgi:hypothetical protein